MATVLITGANRGIGLGLANLYKERGDGVIAICRRSSDELEALGVRVERDVDVKSDDSVAELARRLAGTRLDLLINNAGLHIADQHLADLDLNGVREQLEVNCLGVLRVTKALLLCFGQGSKVAILTSRMGSIGGDPEGGYYGYRISKAAVNMAGATMAREFKERGIAVGVYHPGYVATDMTEYRGTIQPEVSARGLAAQFDQLTIENTGGFWDYKGRAIVW